MMRSPPISGRGWEGMEGDRSKFGIPRCLVLVGFEPGKLSAGSENYFSVFKKYF